jgi:hypothetical protein
MNENEKVRETIFKLSLRVLELTRENEDLKAEIKALKGKKESV